MPMVQVDLRRELFEEKGTAISQAIHAGLIEGLDMPADRRDLVLVRITMVHMFPVDAKRAMYTALVRHLEAAGVRHDDILVCVVEVGFEDWYSGAPIDDDTLAGQR